MGVVDYAKDDFSIRKTGFEARFAGGQGGHRFWLYLFNIVASLFLFVWLAWQTGEIVIVILSIVISSGFVAFFEVDDSWKTLTEWRRTGKMKTYKPSCGCKLKTNDPKGVAQKCRHGNKYVKEVKK